MRIETKMLAVCTLFSIMACRSEPAAPIENLEIVESETRQMMNDYLDAINKEGLLSEFRYLDSSKKFFWVPPGYASSIDYDSVSVILHQMAPAFTAIDMQWDTLTINPLSSSLAAYTGKVLSQMTDTSGVTSAHALLESGVLIKRKDGWKLLCGQSRVAN